MDKKRKRAVKERVAPENVRPTDRILGYASCTPQISDRQAKKIGPAVEWVKAHNDGGFPVKVGLEVWRKGRLHGKKVPDWVRAGIDEGMTSDVRKSAEKNWVEEMRTVATCYECVILVVEINTKFTSRNLSVQNPKTSRREYRGLIERLRSRGSGADLLRDLIDDMERLVNKYRAYKSTAKLLGVLLPEMRTKIKELKRKLDKIYTEASK